MEKAAAFLETRRYAAYKGATTEFSKWEGITFDTKRNKLYTSLTILRQGARGNAAGGRTSAMQSCSQARTLCPRALTRARLVRRHGGLGQRRHPQLQL